MIDIIPPFCLFRLYREPRRVVNFLFTLYTRADSPYGGHGEKVITGVCGTSITGSIPVDRPTKTPSFGWVFLI